ncbi:hypothetical protein TG4357_01648 [Thalassovita gelatinovora]|uniref:DUF1761 domain-containing protein n=1 Tax=Thalassovita gelatinovora TaxID=53501 RepID=A0A0P1FXD7_THAGE|nr:DUF1761 domain-containing protein [Thalassovita gelatinovora]QIZ81024.1 DUF1761 domain-containing protein [Thalassovita gelatinovora]CUH65043.1 hypothetical protein TG4357_01648 [Thalassovita gelatinovora]SEP87507.1 Protein of unknown function [Thalassovita gelatinovora]
MEFLNVFVAALASYAFGAIWYMVNAKAWMAASGVELGENGQPKNRSNPMPYIVSFVCAVIVAGMMRHIFSLAGIDSPAKGVVAGLGIGLFLVTPWVVTNYTFAGRPRLLSLIDGGYATIGCTIMGVILTLF